MLVISLVIEVQDASTKEPLCDATATLTSPQGKEIPTHKPHGDCKSSWVVHAAGKYTLRASHPGYATRTRTVPIGRRDCVFQAPGFMFPLPPLKGAPPKAVK
ncbi:hypothetical protein [Sorangium sp. So ce362]|uniref:hypothetical protein n=1 Tax=Sorangium sp. So ce362 TaxID=3133303 RepID=UPI003F5E62EB